MTAEKIRSFSTFVAAMFVSGMLLTAATSAQLV